MTGAQRVAQQWMAVAPAVHRRQVAELAPFSRIVEFLILLPNSKVLGADPRMKAAFSKLGWNHEHDRQRLLRIIVKRIKLAKGVIRVQLDPAAALADRAQSLETEPKTIEISYDVAKSAAGVEIVTGKQSGNVSR